MKILIIIPLAFIAIIIGRLVIISCNQSNEIDNIEKLPKTIKFWSNDFEQNGTLPIDFTGKGNNSSPSLCWENLPAGTLSLAIIVTDYDAPSPWLKLFTIDHWILFNIDPEINFLERGTKESDLLKKSINLGTNISGGVDYVGPNPPMGVHQYFFRIYALSVSHIDLTKPDKETLFKSMEGKILAFSELKVSY